MSKTTYRLLVICVILISIFKTACKGNNHEAIYQTDTAETVAITQEPMATPTSTTYQTDSPTPEPTATLTAEETEYQYLQELVSMSNEDLILEWCNISDDRLFMQYIGQGVIEGKYTMDQLIENCANFSELRGIESEIYDGTISVGGWNSDDKYRTTSFNCSSGDYVYIKMCFLRDVVVFNHYNGELNYKYDLSSGVTSVYRHKEPWENLLNSSGSRNLMYGFYDRVFEVVSENSVVVDPIGLFFVKECLYKIDYVNENSIMSDEEKMKYVYDEFFMNEDMTPFEKLTAIGMVKNYLINQLESDAFSTVLIEEKTMDDWLSTIQVDTVEELEVLITESNRILTETRENYTTAP